MSDKSPLSATEWMTEIENGLEYRRLFGYEEVWDDIERTFLNDPKGLAPIGSNLIYSMGDSILSSLIVPDPEFTIAPRNPASADNAPLVESVANTLVKQLTLKDEVEKALQHAYLFGTGILKIGYDSEFGFDPKLDVSYTQDSMGMTLSQFDKQGNRIESGLASPGQPWVRAVDPHDFVVPWGTTDLRTAPWVAHRVIRLNSAIKKDPKYKNTSSLQPAISMEAFMDSYHATTQKKPRIVWTSTQYKHNKDQLFNEVWEIHDMTTGRVYAITPDHDKMLRDDTDALQVVGCPFVAGGFVKHPRSFWCSPLAFYLLQIQAIQTDISKQAEKQRRINNLRFLVDETAIKDDELEKVLSCDVGAFAKVKGTKPIRDTVTPFPTGTNQELFYHANWNRQDARDAIGLSRNQLGEYDQSSRRTASEAQIVQEGAMTRHQQRIDVLHNFYVATIKKVVGIVQRFWFSPRSTKVDDKWVFFTGDMLKGEYDYDVFLSTKRHYSIHDRSMEAIQILSMMAQYPGANLPEIEKYLAKVNPNPEFVKFFQSTTQAAQQAAQQQAQGQPMSQSQTAPTVASQPMGGMM